MNTLDRNDTKVGHNYIKECDDETDDGDEKWTKKTTQNDHGWKKQKTWQPKKSPEWNREIVPVCVLTYECIEWSGCKAQSKHDIYI